MINAYTLNMHYSFIDYSEDLAFFIKMQPLEKSASRVAEEVFKKFGFKISPQTITNYRKKLPENIIKSLHNEKNKNIEDIKFVIEILKEEVKVIDDPCLKLKYLQEIFRYVKEINKIIETEIKFQRSINY